MEFRKEEDQMDMNEELDEILRMNDEDQKKKNLGQEPSNKVVVDPNASPSPNIDHTGEKHEKWGE